jgi:hypothetical protein
MNNPKAPNTLESGFEKFAIKNPEGCWGWKGSTSSKWNYGQYRYNMNRIRAHRASWIIHNGPIPEGIHVLHRCDNYICANPEHLFLGTNLDNIKDMLKKNRHPTIGKSGEENIASKLTWDKVKKIREISADSSLKLSQRKIGEMFNISQAVISLILLNKIWRVL